MSLLCCCGPIHDSCTHELWEQLHKTSRQKERKWSRGDILLLAGCDLQWRRMMRIKAPAELKTFPCLPPLFKVRPILALQLAAGHGPCRDCSLDTQSADVSGRGRIRPCLPSLSPVHTNRGRGVPHFLSARHWNLKLRHRGIDELSGTALQSCQGLTPWKWAGPGEKANSLISEGTATFWRARGRADRCTSLMYAGFNVAGAK